MKRKPVPEAPPPRYATLAEINQAIEGLTEGDSERLEALAKNRIARIGPYAAYRRDHEDLLQEAVVRLLDGRRHWEPDRVSFPFCLIGVIRSIASEWAAHRKRHKHSLEYAALESERSTPDGQGGVTSPFEFVSATASNAEEQLVEEAIEAEREGLAHAIEASFADDEPASLVLMAIQDDGMNGPAIQRELGYTETEYRAIVRRVQRRAKKLMEKLYGR